MPFNTEKVNKLAHEAALEKLGIKADLFKVLNFKFRYIEREWNYSRIDNLV